MKHQHQFKGLKIKINVVGQKLMSERIWIDKPLLVGSGKIFLQICNFYNLTSG